ncbi:MAG: DUF3472 domain-containing protein [Pirellulaceae bacterium]|nr:DUF3472 domain-containing protein [Pirellulaceae bacterium]
MHSHLINRAGALLVLLLGTTGRADESLAGIACRSVHLQLPATKGTAFYHEVTVEKSAPGTYFCVGGFNHGYFGLQELASGNKLLIFSVWDPGQQNDPTKVRDEQRVKLLHRDEQVRVGRFGGEGTGGQSFCDFDWQIGTTYRLLVTAKPAGDRTEFTGWFCFPAAKDAGNNAAPAWRRLVTFSTLTGGQPLEGYYAFVEDFRRNRESTKLARRARFGNGWVRGEDGQWQPLTKAKFTADSNPALNIDAGRVEDRFFLATGGETTNSGTKLGSWIEPPPTPSDQPPADLPESP